MTDYLLRAIVGHCGPNFPFTIGDSPLEADTRSEY